MSTLEPDCMCMIQIPACHFLVLWLNLTSLSFAYLICKMNLPINYVIVKMK